MIRAWLVVLGLVLAPGCKRSGCTTPPPTTSGGSAASSGSAACGSIEPGAALTQEQCTCLGGRVSLSRGGGEQAHCAATEQGHRDAPGDLSLARERGLERLAVQRFHDREVAAVLEHAGVGDRHDVRVPEPPRHGRLALEPQDGLPVPAVARVEHLDGDRMRRLQMLRAVDAPHPATSDDSVEPVPVGERAPGLERVFQTGRLEHEDPVGER